MKTVWDASVEKVAAANMDLCQEIQICRQHVAKWKNRLSQLMAQQRAIAQPAALHRNPGLWNRLKKSEKWNHENVKAVLSSQKLDTDAGDLPHALHNWSQVPPACRDSAELFLLRIHRNPTVTGIPRALQRERSVLLSVMKSHPSLLESLPEDSFVWKDHQFYQLLWDSPLDKLSLGPFTLIIGKFDFWMRNDPTLAEKILTDPAKHFFWRTLLDHCHTNRPQPESPLLRNRKSVALHVVQQKGEMLRCFSRRLKDSDEVVQAAVQNDGQALRFGSFRLRRDDTIVKTAIANNPTALVYALDRKRRVRTNLEYCLAFFQHRPQLNDVNMYKAVWKVVPRNFKEKEDLVIAALSCGVQVESSLKLMVDWTKAVRLHPCLWSQAAGSRDSFLPTKFETLDDVLDAIRDFPHLEFSREFYRRVASSGLVNILLGYDDSVFPSQFFRDKEIVVESCRHDHEFLEEVGHGPLSVDRDVLEAAFENSPRALLSMTGNAQLLHPDLVAKAIPSFDREELWDLFDEIDEDIWSNREVASAWIAAGGDFLQDEFPDEFEDDEELFLLVAKHSPHDFWYSSEALCCNKAYMERVVTVNPLLFREAGPGLCSHFDLALKAFGTGPNLPGSYDANNKEDLAFIRVIAATVRREIMRHRAFFQVLAAMRFGDAELRMLNQGLETSTALKKLTSEFLGVASGQELKLLRQASLNLSNWGY